MKNFKILLFLFIINISTYAADLVVNGSGLSDTYSTISAAVNAANNGDKILVSNQAFPYQEDTLFISKGVTILPYSDITNIDFDGQIMITLDSISELTLIGFNSNDTKIFSVFNDTSRNSLSTINIVDCYFEDIHLDQPKTSLYLSYSTASNVFFSHGNIIGNDIKDGILVGIHDDSNETYNKEFFIDQDLNYLNHSGTWAPQQCKVFQNSVDFGNVDVYTDTINIIANNMNNQDVALLSRDFPVHIYNNDNFEIKIYLICPPAKGINRIINNNLNGTDPVSFMMAYCSSNSPTHNIEHINLHILNNNMGGSYSLYFDKPDMNNSSYNEGNMSVLSAGLASYNSGYGASYYFEGSWPTYNSNTNYSSGNSNNLSNPILQLGPGTSSSSTFNPSPEFLDLDLSPNSTGADGGSHAFNNYNPSGQAGFGSMSGSKARITYLNLPTQIFSPANIQIKAKAVHGN
mgnify:CR=1 FL=1